MPSEIDSRVSAEPAHYTADPDPNAAAVQALRITTVAYDALPVFETHQTTQIGQIPARLMRRQWLAAFSLDPWTGWPDDLAVP